MLGMQLASFSEIGSTTNGFWKEPGYSTRNHLLPTKLYASEKNHVQSRRSPTGSIDTDQKFDIANISSTWTES
jgi:hypothetical protein